MEIYKAFLFILFESIFVMLTLAFIDIVVKKAIAIFRNNIFFAFYD